MKLNLDHSQTSMHICFSANIFSCYKYEFYLCIRFPIMALQNFFKECV